MSLENSPVGESESNGLVERAVQTLEGQVRTMLDALQYRLQHEVPAEHPVMTWLTQYAALLIRRTVILDDGTTCFPRLRGRRSQKPVAEFLDTS